MFKKNILIVFLVSLLLLLVACGINKDDMSNNVTTVTPTTLKQSSQKPSPSSLLSYDLNKASYSDKDIKISYPQISNLDDTDKEKTINEMIKVEALKVLSSYDDVSTLTLNVDYSIKWSGENLLSIQYIGSGYVENGAYPNNIFYTTNIDINKGVKIKLKDLFNIDEEFIQKFKEGKYTIFDSELDVENEARKEVDKFSNTELVDFFNNADDIILGNELSVFSYFTKDSLGISVSVPHAIGDHAEFEINYQDIFNKTNAENEVWKDFFGIINK